MDWSAVHEQVYGQVSLQSELRDAQDACSRLEAWWRLVWFHHKPDQRHFEQAPQRLTVVQDKLTRQNALWRALEALLLNVQEAAADQKSLAASTRLILEASLQKGSGDFFLCILDQVHVEESVFCSRSSELCNVVLITAGQQHKDICQGIVERLDRARSLPELGAHDKSAVGGSSVTSSESGGLGVQALLWSSLKFPVD